MTHQTFLILFIVVTLVYLVTLGILYCRYRAASDRLSEELRRLAEEKESRSRSEQEDEDTRMPDQMHEL